MRDIICLMITLLKMLVPSRMEPHWTEPLELLVKREAEKAGSLRWAHDEAQRWCASWDTKLVIPAIILSALTGAGSIGASSLLPFDNSSSLLGIVSIFIGVLQSVQSKFAFAKRSEAHRISSLQYGKIQSYLSLQLSLPRNERKSAEEIILFLQTETDRLSEIAPQIPQAIKDLFHKKFGEPITAIACVLNGLEVVQINSLSSVETPRQTVLRPIVRVEV